MTQSQLIQHISAFDNHIRAVTLRSEVKQRRFTLSELVDLTFYADNPTAVKASRVLQTMLLKFPTNYLGEIEYLVQRVEDVKCESCKKYYARIIMRLTSPEMHRDVRNKVKEINFERIVEICFDWMVDPDMPVSVRAPAAEALFNLRHRYPWIAADLSEHLEYIMRDATPLLKAKGNMILSYLHCED